MARFNVNKGHEIRMAPSLKMELIMIRHIATGLVAAGLALAPSFAFAKTYKTQKTCVKHHMVWKDGKCHKAGGLLLHDRAQRFVKGPVYPSLFFLE